MDKCIERGRKKNQQTSQYHPDSEKFIPPLAGLSSFLAKNTERLGLGVYDFVRLHWLGIINFHLFLFILGSISAPCLSHWGEKGLAKYVYGFYGISCHQIPSRSFFIFANQVAICARCFSFYASLLVFGLLLTLKNFRPLDKRIAFFLALPIIIDVLLQTLGLKESTHLLRITTAVLLSLSISLYIYPRIKVSIGHYTDDPKQVS